MVVVVVVSIGLAQNKRITMRILSAKRPRMPKETPMKKNPDTTVQYGYAE